MARTDDEYKQLSVKEFTKAAKVYDRAMRASTRCARTTTRRCLPSWSASRFPTCSTWGAGRAPSSSFCTGNIPGAPRVGLDLTPTYDRRGKGESLTDASSSSATRSDRPCAQQLRRRVDVEQLPTHYPNPRGSSPACTACCARRPPFCATTPQTISPYGS